MRFALWLGAYFLALALEVSVLPVFFGLGVPSLTLAPLLLGFAFQGFYSGLWLAGLAGLAREIIDPGLGTSHILGAFWLFAAARTALILIRWDEPLRQLGAVLAGLAASPFAAPAAAIVGRVLLGRPYALPQAIVSFGPFPLLETAFAATWFGLAAWLVIRRSRRERIESLTYL